MKILNAIFFLRETLYFDPLDRERNPFFFNILSGLCHRTDPIYHIWKSPLGGP